MKTCKECGKNYETTYMGIKDFCPTCYMNKRHRDTKIRLVNYLGGKCICCGYNKCMDALEFHHVNPSKKEFGLSKAKSKSIEKQIEEVRKCILVCSNCHKEIESRFISCPELPIYFIENTLTINKILREKNTCLTCGNKCKNKYCSSKCYQFGSRKIERPSKEQLQQDIELLGYKSTGRKYSVSDNAIRKWIK